MKINRVSPDGLNAELRDDNNKVLTKATVRDCVEEMWLVGERPATLD